VTVTGTNVTASGVSIGTILTPGQSTTLNVKFAPTKSEVLTGASVKIASNTPNSPTTISVSGTGQAAAPPTSHSVALSWTPSVTTGVNGYNIYRATTSGGYGTIPLNPSPVSGSTYTDTTVVSGQTYFYVAAAVDAGVESTDSNEVQAVIP
jgi:fibronectin type 3 domain-containing protein